MGSAADLLSPMLAPVHANLPVVFFSYSNLRCLCITLCARNFSHCGAELFETGLGVCAAFQ